MNNRALTLALAMAAIAVFFVQSYVSSIEEEAKKKFGTEILVVVARKDIKEMDTINETMLELKLIPKRFKEPSAIVIDKKEQDKDSPKALKELAGLVAVVPIRKDEQLTYNKVTEPNMRTGLSPQIAPGKRAISIPVNEISGVSKLVKPGDRVDLIAVLEVGSGKENKIAKTVLQDVVVLSIGRYVTNNVARVIEGDGNSSTSTRVKPLAQDFSFASVTLEVDPGQAQALALVMANGDNALTLSLRNNDDSDRVNLASSIMSDILGTDINRVKVPARK
ncbi:MAG: Flp pilus assembly protein CpaB [Bdellovibrionia bacterium]